MSEPISHAEYMARKYQMFECGCMRCRQHRTDNMPSTLQTHAETLAKKAILNFDGMLKVIDYHDYMRDGFVERLHNGRYVVLPLGTDTAEIPHLNQIRYEPVGESSEYVYFEGCVYD